MAKVTITTEDLRLLTHHKFGRDVLPLPRASVFAEAMEAQRELAQLNTPLRVAHFMAQIAHETGGFRSLVESLNYSDPARLDALFSNVHGVEHAKRLIAEGQQAIGSCIYASKLGNGGVDTGDGYRYRGRGFLMNTGKDNYREVERYSELPVVEDPDQLGRPPGAAQAAAAFWTTHHLNAAADADRVDDVTRVVNGKSMQGKAERAAWLAEAKKIWT